MPRVLGYVRPVRRDLARPRPIRADLLVRSARASLLALALASPAAAQDAPLVSGPESAELRELRLVERELFGEPDRAEAPETDVHISDGAPSVTTDVPAPRAEAASPSRDLAWMRGLALPDLPVRWDDRVVRFLEFFRNDPRGQRFIRGWMARVNRYGPTIQRNLERQGLPRDLIFVAMVESGFDPNARSDAGAVGMWQFVEATGESFGLTVDHWVDLRLDPERSSEAAGRFLDQLHDRFGSWELALAAYNMGYGALLRAIRKYNTNDYWALSHMEAGLPFETSLYVAKILACAIVAHNPERFGIADLVREEPLRWDTVDVPGGVQLSQLARAAGTNLETMRALNPALRRGRTPPGRERFAVRIPAGSAERFAERWARSRPGSPTHLTRTLRFGETLGDLARTNGWAERELRELNGVGDTERVGAGTILLVPAGARPREETEPPQVVSVPPGLTDVPGRRRVFYRVVRGDDADEIASFFRVSTEELRRWNQIDPDAALQPDMFLQLFVPPGLDLSRALVLTPDECRVLVVGSDEFFAYHEGQNGRVRFRYRIQQGDTLIEIGRRFGIEVASLMRVNQIARDTVLRADEELVVYADPSRVPRELLPQESAPIAQGEPPQSETEPEAPLAPSEPTEPAAD
jgi:membrane-bound lytic murein transglycosylase D